MKHANPCAGPAGSLTPAGLGLLSDDVEERRLREEVGFGTLAEAADLYRPHPPCPACGLSPAWRDSRESSGVQRRRCPSCGARFTSLAGTVLEGCKRPLAAFIRLAMFAAPLDACAEACRTSHHTARGWRHRLFAAVDGYQDRIVLKGRVRVDEAYVSDTDLSKGYGQARRRGLSKQKICIAVGIDSRKEPMAVVCGHGKPSSARIRNAMKLHVARGATLVRDRERAYNALVRELELADESH